MGVMDLRRRIMLNEPHIVTTTPAGIASFSTDMIAPLKSCKVEFSPVQSGSGDPSPSNVRPISGWTGCTVNRTGKNLFDSSAIIENRYLDGNGEVVPNTSWAVSDYIRVCGTFSVSRYSDTGNAPRWCWYDVGKTFLSAFKPQNDSDTLTPPTGAAYLRMSVRKAKVSDIQVELGTTATPYEPYTGSTIPIDWTTEAGTVYGGYVDPVKGELVATWALANFNNASSWNSYGTGDAFFVYHVESSMMLTNYAAGVCDRFPTKTSASQSISTPYIRIGGGNDNGIFFYNVTQLNVTSIAEWKEYIGTTGVNVVYPLATPITYQLTPTQLKSLRGVNSIWSDANGDTTVKFWAH